jgi:hypothetical protein
MTNHFRARTGGVAAALLALGCAAVPVVTAPFAAAQRLPQAGEDDPDRYVTPLVPMRPVPLDRSLAELAASGWRVVGVTLSGRTLHYHLADEGALAVCAVDTMPDAPASRCVRLDPTPR